MYGVGTPHNGWCGYPSQRVVWVGARTACAAQGRLNGEVRQKQRVDQLQREQEVHGCRCGWLLRRIFASTPLRLAPEAYILLHAAAVGS
eukprot:1196273-Prorocentrum_minimum.AAC.1